MKLGTKALATLALAVAATTAPASTPAPFEVEEPPARTGRALSYEEWLKLMETRGLFRAEDLDKLKDPRRLRRVVPRPFEPDRVSPPAVVKPPPPRLEECTACGRG